MKSSYRNPAIAFLAAFFLVLVGVVGCKDNPVDTSETAAQSQDEAALELEDEESLKRPPIPFADAEVFFEFNTTDNDLGLQIFLDAEGWEKVAVADPDRQRLVEIHTQGPLSKLGITELRFESAEPSPQEVLALFPPGEYTFVGKPVEGGRLKSTAELSHDFLPRPTFSPSDGEEVDPDDTVVTWNAPRAEQVEIIIESEETDNVLDIIVDGSTRRLRIPSQFLEPGTTYKIEILAYAENGNRTIVESTFVTQP